MLSAIVTWCKRKTGQDAVLIAIVLLFFAGLLPLAASRVIDTVHTERYYTDGAILMLQSNDFLTPRYGDGKLRFHKPPLIYWILAGSYKLLGISFFSSRVWFLIAGCATIWLAYRLALMLTDDIRTARATAFILLSNLLLIMVSARSTPDVLMVLCMSVSAYGFIRLIYFEDTQSLCFWAAYAGAAVGIAVKGLLPLLFVAYALIFAYFTSSPQRPFRRVLNPGIILVSILISCSWLVLMVWKNGMIFLQSLLYDQIGQTIDLNGKIYPFHHSFLESNSTLQIGAYFLVYIGVLLPWLLCLSYLFYKHKSTTTLTPPQRRTCLFIVIWALLLPIVFGLGQALAIRYLLPAIPLLAVVMAIGLCRFSNSSIAIIADQLLNLVTIGFFVIAVFGLSVLWQTGFLTKHLAGVSILLLVILFVILRFKRKQLSSQAVLSLSFFLILPLSLAIVGPFTLPDQTAQIARALRPLNPAKRPVFVIGTNKVPSRLRISNSGEYPVYEAAVSDLMQQKTGRQSIFVLTEVEARRLPADSFQLRDIAVNPSGISLPKLFRATLKGEAKAYIESRERHCYAVLPDSISINVP